MMKGMMMNLAEVRPLIIVDGLKWWGDSQNNSGGYFIRDDDVDHYVFAQAATAEQAKEVLRNATYESGQDWCECCGERWWISCYEEGSDEPEKYGESILANFSDGIWGGGCILYLASGLKLRTMDGMLFEVVGYE